MWAALAPAATREIPSVPVGKADHRYACATRAEYFCKFPLGSAAQGPLVDGREPMIVQLFAVERLGFDDLDAKPGNPDISARARRQQPDR